MGVCSALLPFLSNPLTYLGIGGAVTLSALLYSYSSYTFLPSMLLLSRLTSPFNFAFNLLTKAWDYGVLKFIAAYTTFSGTINTVLNNGFTGEAVVMIGQEFINKTSMSVKNIVQGLQKIGEYLQTSSTAGNACGFLQNLDVLWEALLLIWTGIAAYIFVVWMWNQAWYSWRNKKMEQQTLILIIIVVSSISLAVYGFDILTQGVENGTSLVNTLGDLAGNHLGNNTTTG